MTFNKKASLFILIFLGFYACRSPKKSFTLESGTYVSKKYQWIEAVYRILLKKENLSIYETLSLNSDSTFKKRSCGGSLFGTYSVSNDTLILHCTKYSKASDSLNILNLDTPGNIYYNIIENNTLYLKSTARKDSVNGKSIKVIEHYIKKE